MTKEEKQRFYDFLVEWYYDEPTAKKLVNGLYEYGCGIEEVDKKRYDEDNDYREYVYNQRENLITDIDLPGTGYWLVGGMI